MASTLKHLLQRFTFWAAGGALVTVLVLASLAGAGVRRTFERLANERGAEVAARATALVTNYVRERHGEADRLAANPSLIRAAIDAGRAVVERRLDRVPPPDLERLVGATHQLGADAELTRYMRGYPERSEFTDLTLTERHGLVVVRSGAPGRLHVGDDALWQRAMKDGAAESEPAIDSSTRTVTVRYAVALRPGEGARPGAAHRDRVGRQRLPAARGPAREPGIRPGRRGVAPGPARHGVVRSGAPARDDPEHGPRPRARCVGAGGARALPRERGPLLGVVPRAAGRRVRHRSGGARLSVARGHRPVGVRRAVDAAARALAQRARGGPRAHSERCRGSRGERRPERGECGRRERRPGGRRAAVVGPDDGARVTPAGRGHPHCGG